MKIPQWFDKTPTHVCHPYATLRQAARVIRHDATRLRKSGLRNQAQAATHYAACLDRVARGMPWAEAFEFLGDAA